MSNIQDVFLQFERKITVSRSRMERLRASRKALESRIIDYFRKSNLPIPRFYIQGSYKMETMILDRKGTYDVDLGIYFPGKPLLTPSTMQKHVLKAVGSHTDGSAQHRAKCIRVIYSKDFDIDIPVYYQGKTDIHPFLATKDKWVQDDPKELCEWFEEKKDSKGQLIRVVKYLKAWTYYRKGKMPSGIALTVWAAMNFKANAKDEVAFINTAINMQASFGRNLKCINPAMPYDDLISNLTADQKENFKTVFKQLIKDGTNAINKRNATEALEIWRQQFRNL